MKRIYLLRYAVVLAMALSFAACDEDDSSSPSPTVPTGDAFFVTASVGGAARTQQVYIDLFEAQTETNGQLATAERNAWDLGLESAGDGYHVVLNTAGKVQANLTSATDFAAVGEADTAGMRFDEKSVDALNGDLSATVFGDWYADAEVSRVAIVDRGSAAEAGGAAYQKVQVTKTDGGYIVRHSDLDGSNEQTVTLTKDAAYNFKFLSFANGETSVEPERSAWDLSIQTVSTPAFFEDGTYFATYQVLGALSNRHGGVEVATVEGEGAYDGITAESVESLTFTENADALGTSWRVLNEQFQYEVNPEIAYVIKDPSGLYFKLRFISYYNLEGEDEPQFEYAFIK